MRRLGNMVYHPGRVVSLEYPPARLREAARRVEAHLGRPRRPRELEFWVWVVFALQRGEVPGPTVLNRCMGLGGGNQLGGNYAVIRRVLFEEAGLVQVNGRYRWPPRPKSVVLWADWA